MSLDIMIDLETTGVKAGCGILSIGASSFDLTKTFYEKIDHETCRKAGLVDDPSTIAWWQKQNPEARAEAFSGKKSIIEVLGAFQTWMNRLDDKQIFVWGNGADFDLPILIAAYNSVGMAVPWKPFNGRCYRTLKNLYKNIPMQEFQGLKHTALSDAKNQAAHARDILRIHFTDE